MLSPVSFFARQGTAYHHKSIYLRDDRQLMDEIVRRPSHKSWTMFITPEPNRAVSELNLVDVGIR